MQIALEKPPIEERIAIVEQIWDSIVQDYDRQQTPISVYEKQLIDERLSHIKNHGFVGRDAKSVLVDTHARLNQHGA